MRALTVRQPWAWAITYGGKDVENRCWSTTHRGLLAIHAASRWDEDGARDRRVVDAAHRERQLLSNPEWFTLGAVIAVADLTSICAGGDRCRCSRWAVPGQEHWHLVGVRPLDEPVPCKGRLSLWDLPAEVEAAVLAQIGVTR